MKKLVALILVLVSVFILAGCGQSEETGPYRQGFYYAYDPQTQVSVHISVNAAGRIEDVFFDQYYNNTTLYTLGDAYKLDSGHSWRNEANYLASYLTLNQGWEGIALDVSDITGLNASTAPDHFITIDYDNSPDSLKYVTMPVDGFVLAWNKAISGASDADIGVVPNVPTSEQWLEANKPPYEYKDGVYYGSDDAHGYIVRVEIKNGFITDVVFDAITAVDARIVWNDNGTPNDSSDDYPEVELVSMTTKMALEDHLVLISGTPWYQEAEMMSDAIIKYQTWDPNWVFVQVGSHEYFDFTDSYTVDSLAGVTLAIEGFRQVFQQAIEKAIID